VFIHLGSIAKKCIQELTNSHSEKAFQTSEKTVSDPCFGTTGLGYLNPRLKFAFSEEFIIAIKR